MNILGNKIKKIRKEMGLTQSELAGDKISRSQLSLIENGYTNPSLSTLEYIASKLNKPYSYFLDDNEDTNDKYIILIDEIESLFLSSLYEDVVDKAMRVITYFNSENFTDPQLLGKTHALLGLSYFKLQDERAYKTLKCALSYFIAQNTGISEYLIKVSNCIATICYNNKQFEEMEQTLLTVDSLILDINLDNIKYKIDVMYNISLSLFSQDKISQAEEVIYRALHYAKEYSVFHNFGELNMLLSLCYKSHKKYIDAINSINKSIEYFSLIGDEAYIHRCYINLGILLRYEAKYEKALYYLNKSMNYFRNSQYTLKYNNCLAEIIKTTFLLNKERIDMEQLRHVIDLNQDDKKNFSELLIILGIIYLRRGNIDKALEVLKESECYFEPSVDAEFKPYLYYSLSIAFSMLGQIDDAIKYLLKHSENINLFTEPIKYFVNNIQ